MRTMVFAFSVLIAGLTGCTRTPQDIARAEAATQATRDKLGKALAGLSPAETTDCISNFPSNSLTTYGPTLVYSVNNNLKYVNDTGGGCEAAEGGDILVTRSPTGRLCRGDFATTVAPVSRIQSGSCSLGSFTVYRKAAK